MQDFLEIGQIVNTFGVKGIVKVVPFTDNVERFEELKTVFLEKNNKIEEKQIEETKFHKNMILVKFKNIETREEAEKYVNAYLKVDRENAISLEEDEYFIADLLGSEVYTDENLLLGKLEDIFNTGSNDIYVVKDEKGKQILLPAIADVIKNIDVKNQKIVVHLLEGLL